MADHDFPVLALPPVRPDMGTGMELAPRAEVVRLRRRLARPTSRLVRDAVVPMAASPPRPRGHPHRARRASTSRTRTPPAWRRRSPRSTNLAPGRILGLGAWWDPLAAKVGIERSTPLRAIREVVAALRRLLADETVSLDGTHVHLDGVELDYVYQERRPKQVPIYVGATGMQMMELAGEIADGVVLDYLVDPSYNIEAMAALDAAWRRPAARWPTSTALNWWCAASIVIAPPPSTAPA